VIDCVAEVRRRESELLTQLRAAFAGDPAVQAFIADRPSIEATLRGLENTCQLTDIIVRERSVELLLLKDDIATRYNRSSSSSSSSIIISANEAKWIGGDYEIMRLIVLSLCVSVCPSVCVHFAWRRYALLRALSSLFIYMSQAARPMAYTHSIRIKKRKKEKQRN